MLCFTISSEAIARHLVPLILRIVPLSQLPTTANNCQRNYSSMCNDMYPRLHSAWTLKRESTRNCTEFPGASGRILVLWNGEWTLCWRCPWSAVIIIFVQICSVLLQDLVEWDWTQLSPVAQEDFRTTTDCNPLCFGLRRVPFAPEDLNNFNQFVWQHVVPLSTTKAILLDACAKVRCARYFTSW